jgi:hypothetical protein
LKAGTRDSDETEGLGVHTRGGIRRAIGVEHEHEEPGILGIVALPASQVARALDLDSLIGVLFGVTGITPGR